MKQKHLIVGFAIVLLISFAWTSVSIANGYILPWWKYSSGGGQITGGGYTLTGTIGQHDTGTMSGGEYKLGGGFWGTIEETETGGSIYLPLVTR